MTTEASRSAARQKATTERAEADPQEVFVSRSGKSFPVRPAYTAFGADKKVVYGPDDVAGTDYERDIGDPGEYPYARGIYPTMYRGRYWTFRQYAGLATALETNERYKYLLSLGQTGLSVAFDLPTQMAMDSDNPRAFGEVGRSGVAVDTLADLEQVFEGIPLDKISTSFTINAPANYILAMYLVLAEKQGVPWSELRGTLQNDILKEYLSRANWVYPPRPSIRLTGDTIEFCMKNAPKMNPLNVCQGHMSEAGAVYIYATALATSNAEVYIQEMLRRGYHIDDFAPQFTFIAVTDLKLLECAAHLRAWRRLWARLMKEKYGATNPKSMMLRMANHGGAPTTLTRREPLNNIARITLWQLISALGGSQSMHLCGYDEAYALPTEESAKLSLRVQQIVAYESDVGEVADPLAGSYYVESMTDRIEEKIREYMAELEAAGGMVAGIEKGQIQREIARQGYEEERDINAGRKTVVGVNKFIDPDEREPEFELYTMDSGVQERQVARLNKVKEERDNAAVERCLHQLKEAAEQEENLLPYMLECARAYATIGEVHNKLKEVYGEFREPVTL